MSTYLDHDGWEQEVTSREGAGTDPTGDSPLVLWDLFTVSQGVPTLSGLPLPLEGHSRSLSTLSQWIGSTVGSDRVDHSLEPHSRRPHPSRSVDRGVYIE